MTSHVHVYIDGSETFDHTGLWQNKRMPDGRQALVLFAWRWPKTGPHTIELQPCANGAAPVDLDTYIVR